MHEPMPDAGAAVSRQLSAVSEEQAESCRLKAVGCCPKADPCTLCGAATVPGTAAGNATIGTLVDGLSGRRPYPLCDGCLAALVGASDPAVAPDPDLFSIAVPLSAAKTAS